MSAVVLVIAAINVAGVRQAAATVNVFTIAKLLPLALLVVVGLPRISSEVLATQAVTTPDWTKAVLLLMFAYGGFEAPLIPAGEAKSPRRDTMPALLAALATIATVYLLVQLVIVGVLPRAAEADAPVAAAYAVLLGPWGASLAVVGALVSVWGYATGATLQSPRLLYSMADRHELPRFLARIHPRFRTPHLAIVAFAVLSLGMALAGSFEGIATLSAIVRLVTYGLTCAALLLLRHQRPQEAPGFRLSAAPIVAPLGMLFCVWLLSTRSLTQTWALVGLMAVGVALWAASGRGRPAPGGAFAD
jgi:amino acid transporter